MELAFVVSSPHAGVKDGKHMNNSSGSISSAEYVIQRAFEGAIGIATHWVEA